MTDAAPVYTGVEDLRRIARELLEAGDVRVVIGWEHARRGARPVFISDPADADKLIFDTRCVHNLVTYLNPRRDHVAELGKIGARRQGLRREGRRRPAARGAARRATTSS